MATASNHTEFQQINQTFETEVISKRDFSALSRVYTAEAKLLPPGAEMLTGLEQIQKFWEQAVSTLNIQSLHLTTLDFKVVGDSAFEIGRAEMHTNQPTSPTTVKYVVVWKRDSNGWRWDVDIWNADAESHQQQ